MLTLTAAQLGNASELHIGHTVEFHDFHGRVITGTLQAASNPPTAAYALIRVDDRERAVWKGSPVKVGLIPPPPVAAHRLNHNHAGQHVTFEAADGTTVTGTLHDAYSPVGVITASLTVDGRTYAVTKLTPVTVR